MDGKRFFDNSATPWIELGGGVRRKILPWTDELMAVYMEFDKGAEGPLHAHDGHTQITYIIKGCFEIVLGNEKKILMAGDAFLAEKNVPHGVKALEEGWVMDLFTPKRADFLK